MLRWSNPRGAGKSPTTHLLGFFYGYAMQNDIDIFRDIKSAIRKNPENFKLAGKWLDDFCQDIVNQAEQRIQKLPQIKSAALSEIQNKKSLLKNIQHKHETLRKRIAPHEHNDEKFKEEKQRLSKLHAKAYQLTLEVHEIGKELEKIESSSQDEPSFHLLMSKASGEAFCEYPPDSRKIMVIAWVVTDRFLSDSKLGITKYEQYAFNHEVTGKSPQLLTVQEWAKEAVLARPDAMEIIRDAYLSYKELLPEESSGKAGDKKTKRGRQKKYTPEILKAMQKLFDDEVEKQKDKDVKAAWSKVAEVFNIKNAKAAEMAVRRYQKQNK